MYDKHYIGLDLTGFQDNGFQRPISRVTLVVDDEHIITAGDDTGLELSADCPHATQTMANSILAQVRGYRYHMFTADDTNLDPAAEPGDGVTAGTVYSVLSRISSDGSGYAGITAPGKEDLEDECPVTGPMTQVFQRKIAETRSMILKKADEITLKVENEVQQLSASFTVKLDSITSTVQGQGRQLSSLRQYVDNITLEVSNGYTSSTITLKSGSVAIASQTIEMNGLVTFTGLAAGTTTINGACIRTGTIDAARLNLTGAITFSDLSRDVQNDIDGAWSMASDAQDLANEVDRTVGGWVYPGTTEIDGRSIRSGTVTASTLEGGEIYLLDYAGRRAGSFTLEGASSFYGQKVVLESGGIELNSLYGSLYLSSGSGASLELSTYGEFGCNIGPDRAGGHSCGMSSKPWSDVYAGNDVIQTSDRRKKADISYGLSAYGALLDALRPASYRFRDGQSGRTHLGLIAQDVEEALKACGLTGMDFAGFVKSPRLDGTGQAIEGEYDYALRYGEFIPLLIAGYQALAARTAELERRISA